MTHFKILKVVFAIISIIAAFSVGLFVSIFIGIITTFQVFFRFPIRIYNSLVEAEITRLKIEAFNVQTSTGEDEETVADKMWERHIRRMKEKEQNKNI
tara:strand:- start:1416 stop:1709 length:294 start_codon:yes stop_codon:yes gene_type:complete